MRAVLFGMDHGIDATCTAGARRRVVICDSRPIVALGLSTALGGQSDLEVAGVTSSSARILELTARTRPELLIVHSRMVPTGALFLIPMLRRHFPDLGVLVLADSTEPLLVAELLRAGANGIAHVSQPIDELLGAIRTTLNGSRFVSPSFDPETVYNSLHGSPLEALTLREREIFVLLGDGMSNTDIAQRLFISSRTVETHRHRIMRKLGVHSISDLVRIAGRLDVIGWTPAHTTS